MDGDPRQLAVDLLALTGMEADADVEPELLDGRHDRRSGAQRLGRLSERRIEAVSRGVLLASAPTLQLASHDLPEPAQYLTPAVVT